MQYRICKSLLPLALCVSLPAVWSALAAPPSPVVNAVAPAIDSELRRELESLAGKSAEIRDLTARFEQRRFTTLLKRPLVSTGRIWFKQGRMRWETDKPHPSVTVVDSGDLRVYYPQHSKLEIYPVEGSMGELARGSFPKPEVLLKYFHIERLPAESSGGRFVVQLTPLERSTREHLRRIVVHLDHDSGLIRQLEWTDGDGERTYITLTEMSANAGVADEEFELRVPPGTKTVRPLGPGSSRGGAPR